MELTGEGVDSAVMQHSVDRSRRYGSVNGFLEIKHQKKLWIGCQMIKYDHECQMVKNGQEGQQKSRMY